MYRFTLSAAAMRLVPEIMNESPTLAVKGASILMSELKRGK
jgi:hypothetical protein